MRRWIPMLVVLGVVIATAAVLAWTSRVWTERPGGPPLTVESVLRGGVTRFTPEAALGFGDGLETGGCPEVARVVYEAAWRGGSPGGHAWDELARRRVAFDSSPLVARLLEHLSALPTRESYQAMALGLSIPGPDGGCATASDLQWLLDQPRSDLAKRGSVQSALNLLARRALEREDAGRAEALLGLRGEPDPEGWWLLSRVSLLRGDATQTRERWQRAIDAQFDSETDGDEPSRYVGAAKCAECHADRVRSQQASRHAGTIRAGAELRDVPLPDGSLADPERPDVQHRFLRENDRIRLETTIDGRTLVAFMTYALGSGRHGMTMVGQDQAGQWRQARLSHYHDESTGATRWGLTGGFNPLPRDDEEYLGQLLGDVAAKKCLNCHVTRFAGFDRAEPEAKDRGIGCERCHGPGANHVRAVAIGLDDPALSVHSRSSPKRRFAVCAECHGVNNPDTANDPDFLRAQSATLATSRCFTQSQGRLDCVTCHDPHEDVNRDAKAYERRCAECHGGTDQTRCSVNTVSGCVGCHMPKVRNPKVHAAFTDHSLRKR